ncbi:MAG: hypothetical protein IPP91_13785 [Betaproteobacteria bacterium]|nr:hypothetical protein [Betaproteobacteria bacterium]
MSTDPAGNRASDEAPSINVMHVMYALFAAGFLTGGVTTIAGVILAYVKRSDLAGSWLGTHVEWMIKTFWWGLVGGLAFGALAVFVIGIPLLIFLACWVIYRIVKGWLRLNEKRPID